MPDEKLPLPVEIPWQILATRLSFDPLIGPEHDTTSISVFTYFPKLESLESDYPDDRLVYLKFSASISPYFFTGPAAPSNIHDAFRLLDDGGLPVWRVILDVKISTHQEEQVDFKPYFLSAAPLRRTMLETGVVGNQVYEGESNSLAVGKSGSQMHEAFNTSTETASSSKGIGAVIPILPVVIGGGISKSTTGTSVSGGRDVTQVVDSTQRNASDERRELLSHMTNVNNVLTLLRTTLVGTPFLRFDLMPRPLRPLTMDPSDKNLWYAELLKRRSSGIEGVQDFYAVAVIPRDAPAFCVDANLQRVFIAEPPLPVRNFNLPDNGSPIISFLITNYMYQRYPRGTPVDELDALAEAGGEGATIVGWHVTSESVSFASIKRVPPGGLAAAMVIPYKTRAEVWLEMLRDQYETEMAKSPLERGFVLHDSLLLTACQLIKKDVPVPLLPITTGLTLSDEERKQSPKLIYFRPRSSGDAAAREGRSGRDQYRDAVRSWNTMDLQLTTQLSGFGPEKTREFRFDDPRVLDYLLTTAANLDPEDPVNRSPDEVAGLSGLTPEQLGSLKAAGVNDLRTFATAIKFAPLLERQNREREELLGRAARPQASARGCNPLYAFWMWLTGRRPPRSVEATLPAPEPIQVNSGQAVELRAALGAALQARFEKARQTKKPEKS